MAVQNTATDICRLLAFLVLMTSCLSQRLYDAQITNTWAGGFQGILMVNPPEEMHGWKIHVLFSKPMDVFEVYVAEVESHTPQEWIIHNMEHDKDLFPGTILQIDFVARGAGNQPGKVQFWIESLSGGATTSTRTTSAATTATTTAMHPTTPDLGTASITGLNMKYDYSKAMALSILFYDAQRSGRLPANNPISWRGDSAVNDGDAGHDLSGGWYDAGDHMKFNLPMAWATWVLNYGFLKFKDAYIAANQKDKMCNMLRTPLEYFLKCWIPDRNTLYVQVGNPHLDHAYWGRPENMTMPRPAYYVTSTCPGSDVAGKMSSALSSGYLVFMDICGDLPFANKLLVAAKSLYTFAKDNTGLYTDCVKQVQNFYGSSGYKDELSTAAAWLYKATKNTSYLSEAERFYEGGTAWGFNWNDDNVGAALLLYEDTHNGTYKRDIESFITTYSSGTAVAHTPCGLTFRDTWGPNRHAANAAFIAVVAAADGIRPVPMQTYALGQIDYILGDNRQHMSYEIGFGNVYPRNPHHRGSSCTASDSGCDLYARGDNPNLLLGALVGGPNAHDTYVDDRSNYQQNEVALDYNAGFQGAAAGLYHFALINELPYAPASKC